MKRKIDIFSKEEIEAQGFIYEQDETKCKYGKTKAHFDCNYFKNGEFLDEDKVEEYIDETWKKLCWSTKLKPDLEGRKITHIHSIFVPSISPPKDNTHGVMCRWVMYLGHK